MKITDRIKAATSAFRASTVNTMGTDLSRQFLKYGNRTPMVQDWSQVAMNDEDLYTGYSYAAINNRANRVAQLAEFNLKTDASPEYIQNAKKKQETIVHPYLTIIDESDDFTNNEFWYNASTYLDLEGVYYILAIRTVEENRVGNVQSFKLLNPYEVRRIRNKDTLEIGGYVEMRDGLVRELSPKMIIDIRKLNPFNRDDPFAMTDAAKESQFTLKQAGDYTRHSLKNNMAAPGIISTDVMLEEEMFKNFVARVTNQEKGVPLFGNGAGAITWDAMQIDLDKTGLDKINEISRSSLMAVSGAGKTMLSIEESGTTRDTAKVQKDLFIEGHVMPQLRIIIDALNQDYKKYYKSEYTKNRYRLYIDNPLGSDRDAELKDIEIRKNSLDLYNSLIEEGYETEIASKYAMGEITLEELGEPTKPIVEQPKPEPTQPELKSVDISKEAHEHVHDVHVEAVRNIFDDESQGIISSQQGALQNAVTSIQARLVNSVLNRVTKNAFDSESDIITKREQKDFEQELELALAAFYGIIIPLYATSVINRRTKEFGLFADFKLNNEVKKYIKSTAGKASLSHIDTIVGDLFKVVREQALAGASQQEITSAIRKEFSETISATRAKTIARTEMNRAFTQSQYQADKQFIKQNDLQGRAFKKWVTRSDNPCPLCLQKASEPPIPFDNAFAEIGDEITVVYEDDGKTKVLKQKVSFETVESGNLHVNCACIYQLIIE